MLVWLISADLRFYSSDFCGAFRLMFDLVLVLLACLWWLVSCAWFVLALVFMVT